MDRDEDTMYRFLIENSDVRGECVYLDETWRAMLERNDYPPAVRQVLGEAVTALALLSATIKYEGSMTLQIRGDGPLYLVIAHCTSDATLRGLARWRGDTDGCSFPELMGSALLVMSIDPGPGKDRYQGIVAVDQEGLSDVLQTYFDRSEQLPTRLWLATDDHSSAGLLLQKLPGRATPDDTWKRVTGSTSGLTPEQLLKLPVRELLTGLYARETVRLFSGTSLRYGCHCSRGRAEDTIRALGQQEFDEELTNQLPVQVDCEFCNRRYTFDAVDLAMLFTDSPVIDARDTHH